MVRRDKDFEDLQKVAFHHVVARNNLNGKPGAVMYASGLKKMSLSPREARKFVAEDSAWSCATRIECMDPVNLKTTHPAVVDAKIIPITLEQKREGYDLKALAHAVYGMKL